MGKSICRGNVQKIIISLFDRITLTDAVIATDVVTITFTYSIGITNLEFVICLGDDTDGAGNIIGDHKIPYSFRIEEIQIGIIN